MVTTAMSQAQERAGIRRVSAETVLMVDLRRFCTSHSLFIHCQCMRLVPVFALATNGKVYCCG